jgi:hypothetical protein
LWTGKARLEIEIRPTSEEFIGEANATSLFLSSSSTAIVVVGNLANGSYHWRARAADDGGHAAEWQEIGPSGNADFAVYASAPIPPRQTIFDAQAGPFMGYGGCQSVMGDGGTISNIQVKYRSVTAADSPQFMLATPAHPADFNDCLANNLLAVSGADGLTDYDWHDINFTFDPVALEAGKRYLYLFSCTNGGCYVGGSVSDTYSGGRWLSGASASGSIEDAYFTSDGATTTIPL